MELPEVLVTILVQVIVVMLVHLERVQIKQVVVGQVRHQIKEVIKEQEMERQVLVGQVVLVVLVFTIHK